MTIIIIIIIIIITSMDYKARNKTFSDRGAVTTRASNGASGTRFSLKTSSLCLITCLYHIPPSLSSSKPPVYRRMYSHVA